MSKQRRTEQKPKDMGNRDLYDAMQEIRRSGATTTRNRKHYRRADVRNNMQRGIYHD